MNDLRTKHPPPRELHASCPAKVTVLAPVHSLLKYGLIWCNDKETVVEYFTSRRKRDSAHASLRRGANGWDHKGRFVLLPPVLHATGGRLPPPPPTASHAGKKSPARQ